MPHYTPALSLLASHFSLSSIAPIKCCPLVHTATQIQVPLKKNSHGCIGRVGLIIAVPIVAEEKFGP